jgi:hypothetical protein
MKMTMITDNGDDGANENKKQEAPLSYKHILVPTMMYFTLIFALYPLQIQILIQAICDRKGTDDDSYTDESDDGDCDSAAISSRAAIINTYCSIALYLPTILLTGEHIMSLRCFSTYSTLISSPISPPQSTAYIYIYHPIS